MKRRTLLAGLVAAGPIMAADDPTAISVATGRNGQTAWEFIGAISQYGAVMNMTGYLTAIAGLNEAQLFDDANVRSADTARFRFSAEGKMTTRNVMVPLFVLNSVATGAISFRDGGMAPVTIAELDSTYQTVVDVIAQGKGQFSASGQSVRTTAENFTIDGISYRLGEPNRVLHVTMSGNGTLTDPSGPVSTIVVAGRAVIGDYLPQR